jgi:hypothetical protein
LAFNSRTTRIASSALTPATNLDANCHEKLQFVTNLCAQPDFDRVMKNERSIVPSCTGNLFGNCPVNHPNIKIILAQTKKLSDILFRYER